jgi:hypothetical protein
MSFVIEKNYVLVPQGTYVGIIVDVEDLKVVDTSFGKKHACRVYFQLNELMPESDQRFVVARRYTVSLHHASALHGLLSTLLGAGFDDTRVDLEEALLGKPCLVAIEHNQGSDNNVYANITSVSRLPRDVKPIAVKDYVRHKDRDGGNSGSNGSAQPVISKPKPVPVAPAAAKTELAGITGEDVSASANAATEAAKPEPASGGEDDPSFSAKDLSEDDLPF